MGYPDKCGDAAIHGWLKLHSRPPHPDCTRTRNKQNSSAVFLTPLPVSIIWTGWAELHLSGYPAKVFILSFRGAK